MQEKLRDPLWEMMRECKAMSRTALSLSAYLQDRLPPEITGEQRSALTLSVVALYYRQERGDICLRLEGGNGEPSPVEAVLEEWTERAILLGRPYEQTQVEKIVKASRLLLQKVPSLSAALSHLPCVYEADAQQGIVPDVPLVLSLRRLYFRRYYLYECEAASFVALNRALPYATCKRDFIRQALEVLFPDSQDKVEWQKVAAAFASLKRFAIISGGPGTGKTTTVTRLLLLLLALDPGLRTICLCAPTGKAAARMAQSVSYQLSRPEVQTAAEGLARLAGLESGAKLSAFIPQSATTVHSLIKVVPHRVTARFNSERVLPCDILVVDEVSMLDLSLFNKLINAVDEKTCVIMLGDRDQLCSVEAGAVLGDLCASLGESEEQELLKTLASLTGYSAESLNRGKVSAEACLLSVSHRFDENSGIGVLAKVINARRAREVELNMERLAYPELRKTLQEAQKDDSAESYAKTKIKLIQQIFASFKDVVFKGVETGEKHNPEDTEQPLNDALSFLTRECLNPGAKDNYAPFLNYIKERDFILSDAEALVAFKLLDNFRVLCSNRRGVLGDLEINAALEKAVRRLYPDPHGDRVLPEGYFPGRVVLITKNNPILRVHNGDVGFVAYEPAPDGSAGALKLFLPNEKGGVDKISPLFIEHQESGFAMTVHKSQGSEYFRVLIVLSERDNAVLSRELVYTAVTRAKKELLLFANREILGRAVNRAAVRESGLRERIALLKGK